MLASEPGPEEGEQGEVLQVRKPKLALGWACSLPGEGKEKGWSQESQLGGGRQLGKATPAPPPQGLQSGGRAVSPLPNWGAGAVTTEKGGKWYLGTRSEQGEPEEFIAGHKGTLWSSHLPP